METTQEERDCVRKHWPEVGLYQRLLDDADRLAAIEPQVLWRTDEMPEKARYWRKYSIESAAPECVYKDMFGRELGGAPDYRPDESGPCFLPILEGDKNE